MITRKKINKKSPTNYSWFDINQLTDNDLKQLRQFLHFTPALIEYLSDIHERPHYDYDAATNSSLVVYDLPVWPKDKQKHFTTQPVILLVQGTTVFTFHSDDTNYALENFSQKELNQITDAYDFVVNFLLHAASYFNSALTTLNIERNNLDARLNESIKNSDLLQLAKIEKSFVYLSSSLQTNLIMLESLSHHKEHFTLSSQSREKLDDVFIELRQANRMVNISSEVTEKISMTSNNILNNNLNDIMNFMTVWSLILTIPTIITGFYGMNVALPFMHQKLSWLLISFIMLILMGLLLWFFKKRKMF